VPAIRQADMEYLVVIPLASYTAGFKIARVSHGLRGMCSFCLRHLQCGRVPNVWACPRTA
jgi:hypothetical protein